MTRHVDINSFGFLVADVARLMRNEMDRAIAQAGIGLTPGEVRALVHAARAGQSRQLALAERMGVEPMTLSTYLDQLEAKGLIRREADPSDRRAKLVTLTDEADPVLDGIIAMSGRLREVALSGIDGPARDALRGALMQARSNLCESRELAANSQGASP